MDYLASPIPSGEIALPADLRPAICVFTTETMALEAAEDHSAIDGRSGVLLGVQATEVLYLRNLLERMGFAEPQPTPVYEDNTAWGEQC